MCPPPQALLQLVLLRDAEFFSLPLQRFPQAVMILGIQAGRVNKTIKQRWISLQMSRGRGRPEELGVLNLTKGIKGLEMCLPVECLTQQSFNFIKK